MAISHILLLHVFHLVSIRPAPALRALGFKGDQGEEEEAHRSEEGDNEREREHSDTKLAGLQGMSEGDVGRHCLCRRQCSG